MIKSPFMVLPEFISPLMCEDIVDACSFIVPDTDKDGKYIKTSRRNEIAQRIIFERIQEIVPALETYYSLKYVGTEPITIDWYAEGTMEPTHAENSTFVSNNWVRTSARSLSAVLFLSDYNDTPTFDVEFEVYGGKLEFPQHGFGFNPQRGTLIVYPSFPNFINHTTTCVVGNLYQARIHITGNSNWLYDPRSYPGDYTKWFADL